MCDKHSLSILSIPYIIGQMKMFLLLVNHYVMPFDRPRNKTIAYIIIFILFFILNTVLLDVYFDIQLFSISIDKDLLFYIGLPFIGMSIYLCCEFFVKLPKWRIRFSRCRIPNISSELVYKFDSYNIHKNFFFSIPIIEKINTAYKLEVYKNEIPIANLPLELNSVRCLHLSDLHFGNYMEDGYFEELIEQANALRPDFTIYTGDLLTFAKFADSCAVLLKKLQYGSALFAIPGNHDYWSGLDLTKEIISSIGGEFLVNERRIFEFKGSSIEIVGLDDFWEGKLEYHNLLREQPKAPFRILLAHHPDYFTLTKKYNVQLTLSGHNHGGQIVFPYIGPLTVPSMYGRKYISGFYKENNRIIYISRGIGSYPPFRLGCSPCIDLHILKRGE